MKKLSKISQTEKRGMMMSLLPGSTKSKFDPTLFQFNDNIFHGKNGTLALNQEEKVIKKKLTEIQNKYGGKDGKPGSDAQNNMRDMKEKTQNLTALLDSKMKELNGGKWYNGLILVVVVFMLLIFFGVAYFLKNKEGKKYSDEVISYLDQVETKRFQLELEKKQIKVMKDMLFENKEEEKKVVENGEDSEKDEGEVTTKLRKEK